jgi:hypothetical protein
MEYLVEAWLSVHGLNPSYSFLYLLLQAEIECQPVDFPHSIVGVRLPAGITHLGY